MTKNLGYIDENPNEFIICRSCGVINHNENTECISCGCHDFIEDQSTINERIQEEVQYQINNHGHDLESIYDIHKEVA